MKLLLISNGNLAKEMYHAMERFYAKPSIDFIGLDERNLDAFRQNLKDYLTKAKEDVLMVCDFFGSAAFNEAAYFMKKNSAEKYGVLCGMNLPMVFKLYGLKDEWSMAEIESLYEGTAAAGVHAHLETSLG